MAYAIVQQKDAFNNSATSIATGNFASSITAGNLIYVVASADSAATAFNTPTDTLGNTYTAIGNATESGTGTFAYHWYAKNVNGGTNSITVTVTGAATVIGIAAVEISGLDTTAPYDVSAIQGAQVGSSGANAMTSGSATNTQQPSVIIGFQRDLQGAVESAGTSPIAFTALTAFWNNLGGSGVNNGLFEHARLTTTGSVQATFQDTGFDRYLASMAVFKEGSGGGGGSSTPYPVANAQRNRRSSGRYL